MEQLTREQVDELVREAVEKTEKSFGGTFKRMKAEAEELQARAEAEKALLEEERARFTEERLALEERIAGFEAGIAANLEPGAPVNPTNPASRSAGAVRDRKAEAAREALRDMAKRGMIR